MLTAGLQTSNIDHFQRKIQLSGFSAYPDGWPSKLIRISGVLLYSYIKLKCGGRAGAIPCIHNPGCLSPRAVAYRGVEAPPQEPTGGNVDPRAAPNTVQKNLLYLLGIKPRVFARPVTILDTMLSYPVPEVSLFL